MRILMNDVAILERSGLRFIGVANQIDGLFLVRLDEAPFHPARKTGATSSAQARCLDFIHDLLSRHLERGLELLVTAVTNVAIDIGRVALASDVLENKAAFEGMGRGSLDREAWIANRRKNRKACWINPFQQVMDNHENRCCHN